MDTKFHLTLYGACAYLLMLVLNLIHVIKRTPGDRLNVKQPAYHYILLIKIRRRYDRLIVIMEIVRYGKAGFILKRILVISNRGIAIPHPLLPMFMYGDSCSGVD